MTLTDWIALNECSNVHYYPRYFHVAREGASAPASWVDGYHLQHPLILSIWILGHVTTLFNKTCNVTFRCRHKHDPCACACMSVFSHLPMYTRYKNIIPYMRQEGSGCLVQVS
ncbi:hypothetical protein OTU49_015265, partial [Cherax quadricarinatus]